MSAMLLRRLRPFAFVCLGLQLSGTSCQRKPEPLLSVQSQPASDKAPAPNPTDNAAASAAATAAAAPAPPQLKAEVHVPADLKAGEKRPLVIILHGLGASGAAIERHTDWPALAAKQRFFWIAPDGELDSQGRRFWNAWSSCCNFDKKPIDHIAMLRDLILRTQQTHPIDPVRVFVLGYSNGGFMAHRVACELSDVVTSVVSIAGVGPNAGEACAPARGIRVLELHGDADDIVSFAGGRLFGKATYPTHISVERTLSDWAARLDCGRKPELIGSLDLDPNGQGAETQMARFPGCKRGSLELWTVAGGGHYIATRSKALEAIWKYLDRP